MLAIRTLAVICAVGVAAIVSPCLLAESVALELPEGAVVKVEIVEPPRGWLDRAPEWIAAFALLLGAGGGFLGGTVINHRFEIRRRKMQHDDEAVALAYALYAEISQIWKDAEWLQVLCKHHKEEERRIESEEVVLFDFHDLNYLNNISRLGLLGSRCANLVVEVYGRTASVKRFIKAADGGEPEWAIPELGTILEATDRATLALRDFANELRPGTIE